MPTTRRCFPKSPGTLVARIPKVNVIRDVANGAIKATMILKVDELGLEHRIEHAIKLS